MTRAITEKEFDGFERQNLNLVFVTMTQYDKTLQNVIDNPNSVTKLSTDKFHKIANKSSWEFKPTQNNKGYRALKGDMSIRYNMNGTRFDTAHFGGSPYWVISSAKNGTIKIMMP